jgi:hypothetical protein
MPRHHIVGANGTQTRVPFTAEEETARDAEEAAWAAGSAARDALIARRAVLNDKLADGSITHAELVELLQHRQS